MPEMRPYREPCSRGGVRLTAYGRRVLLAGLWLLLGVALVSLAGPGATRLRDSALVPRAGLTTAELGDGCGGGGGVVGALGRSVAAIVTGGSADGSDESGTRPGSIDRGPSMTTVAGSLALTSVAAVAVSDAASARSAPIGGVDVSHWNGIVPFERVRDAGMRFAFMKATQGTSFIDHTFVEQFANARAAGLVAGGYHFYDYRVEGAPQAEHFLRVLEAAGALEASLPPVVDLECFEPFGAADQAYVRVELRAFVDTIVARTGRLPIIYTSAHMWDQLTGGDRSFGANPLWVACWGCDSPGLPAGWDRWHFWQTGAVRIPGMDAKIGEDRFVGDVEALAGLTGQAFVVHATSGVTNQREVDLRFVDLEADAVRIAFDDRPWGRWRPWRGTVRVRLPDVDGRHVVRIGTRRGDVLGSVFRHPLRLDREPPRIVGVRPRFALGARGPEPSRRRIAARVAVRGLGTSGHVEVQARCGEAIIRLPVVGARSRRDPAGALPLDRACRLIAIATDAAGNTSAWQAPSPFQLTELSAEPSGQFTYSGMWDRTTSTGGARATWTSSEPGSTATLRFSGDAVAVVARHGPDAGSLAVRLDGALVERVDLWASEPTESRVVAAVDITGGAGREHQLELRVLEGQRTSVTIEGLLVMHSSPS